MTALRIWRAWGLHMFAQSCVGRRLNMFQGCNHWLHADLFISKSSDKTLLSQKYQLLSPSPSQRSGIIVTSQTEGPWKSLMAPQRFLLSLPWLWPCIVLQQLSCCRSGKTKKINERSKEHETKSCPPERTALSSAQHTFPSSCLYSIIAVQWHYPTAILLFTKGWSMWRHLR